MVLASPLVGGRCARRNAAVVPPMVLFDELEMEMPVPLVMVPSAALPPDVSVPM